MRITFTPNEWDGFDEFDVTEEFGEVLRWLIVERLSYQPGKYDYADSDLEHAKEGLTDDAWFTTRGWENYAGRVRVWQRELGDTWYENPLAVQALLKLAATFVCIPEHLLRACLPTLPKPGLPSGELG